MYFGHLGQEPVVAVTPDKPVPYAPTSAILEVVDRFRNRGLQSPIGAEVLARIGISESLIPRTLQALRTLDLIDEEGKPSATLEGLHLAPETEYKKHLEAWLKSAYAPVFSFVDPTKDDETRIRDAFRGYNPAAQQARMISLFTGLCTAAGLIAEKRESAPRSARVAASVPIGTPRQRTIAKRIVNERFKDASRPPSGIPAPLAGLLASLPAEGDTWTKAERAKFITTFTAVLDFCFAIEEGDKTKTETAA
jgi:hypothetical protein